MRHTGNQLFTNAEVSNEADIYKLSAVDKLNIPIRRSLPDYEYADLFMEANAVNVVDGNTDIIQLLDIHNPDVIKSLLTSEIFFDEFMNFDKTDTGSFNEEINLQEDEFKQYDINSTYDVTTV